MRIKLLIVPILAAVFLFPLMLYSAATTQPADSSPLLTADETKQIDKVIASMLAAGFPDGKNAVVYYGKISVRAKFDPAKRAMPLPSDASNIQETIPNSAEVVYGYQFDGLHFKLADGSWVIAMSYHFVPQAGDSVDATTAAQVNLATLSADATAAHAYDAAASAPKSLALIVPEQRERSRRAMNRLVPVLIQLQIDPDSMAPAVILLQRAGWSGAEELTLAIADIRARSYWQLRPWTSPEAVFDPTGQYDGAKTEQEAWIKDHPTYTSEPPAVALRRAMFRVCRGQLNIYDPEDELLPVKIAIAGAKAAVDENDPQKNGARIDAMAAGVALPVTPAAGADLAARLQSWEAGARAPKMVVTSPNGNAGNASIATGFYAPPPAYVPDKKDLDGLVALLGDERPSRFSDFSGPRTVGDNAWRALATLLKSDPRTLAGYPTDHAWTAAERQAAAKAVQQWWSGHRGEYVGK